MPASLALTVHSALVDDAIHWAITGDNYAVVANEGERILSDPLVDFGGFQMPLRRYVAGRKVFRTTGYTVLYPGVLTPSSEACADVRAWQRDRQAAR